jgi:hypothetical protein
LKSVAPDAAFLKPVSFEGGIKDLFSNIKEEPMDKNNRVLGRMGARELTEQEVDTVQGAFQVRHTLTPCFIDKKQQLLNGDQAIGECGP